jgi:hypothetical protein
MGIQEGLWDCPNCEGTNKGSHLKCQGCGATREEDAEFYLPEGAVDILPDNPLYAMAEAGADWICPYCDTSNRATSTRCTNCQGAEKSEGTSREVKDVPDPVQEKPKPEAAPAPPPKKEAKDTSGCLKIAGAVLLVLLLLGYYLTRTHTVTMKVAKSQWTQTIELEKYATYDEAEWRSKLPSGSSEYASTRKIREYRQVFDHYANRTRQKTRKVKIGTEKYKCGKKNMGNGFFKDKYCTRDKYKNETYTESYKEKIYRKEPVYDDWVKYKIKKWKKTAPVSLSSGDHQPKWPSFPASDTLHETRREGKYLLYIEDPKNKKNYEFQCKDLKQFAKFPPGTKVVGTVSNSGTLKEIALPGEKKK